MAWVLIIFGLIVFVWGFHDILPEARQKKGHYPLPVKTARWFVAVGVVTSLTGAAVYAETHLAARESSTSIAVAAHDPVTAWTMCQAFVGDRLLSPRSAKYPWRSTSEFVTFLGGTSYRIENYVDSQNANGVLVRTPFICEVTWENSASRWRLDSLVMQQGQ